MTKAFTVTSQAEEYLQCCCRWRKCFVTIPEGNYKGDTLAAALQDRINAMKNPVSGQSVGGVTVDYNADTNSFSFTTATSGEDHNCR